jgi:signal peptidase I
MIASWLKRNRGFLVFLLCLGVLRTAVADWNPIPSGSMRPTLLEGDLIFVNRLAYNLKLPLTDIVLAELGQPRRGDVVTFFSPQDGTRLVKRIVALPGDQVELRDEVLWVNGEAARYEDIEPVSEPAANALGAPLPARRVTEVTPGHAHRIQWLDATKTARRSFPPQVMPRDSYWMLGDNRDDSADSRYIGAVPRHLLIGQARRILLSADMLGSWAPRWNRFGLALR